MLSRRRFSPFCKTLENLLIKRTRYYTNATCQHPIKKKYFVSWRMIHLFSNSLRFLTTTSKPGQIFEFNTLQIIFQILLYAKDCVQIRQKINRTIIFFFFRKRWKNPIRLCASFFPLFDVIWQKISLKENIFRHESLIKTLIVDQGARIESKPRWNCYYMEQSQYFSIRSLAAGGSTHK